MLTQKYDSLLISYFILICFPTITMTSVLWQEGSCPDNWRPFGKQCTLSACTLFKKSPTGQQIITFIHQLSPKSTVHLAICDSDTASSRRSSGKKIVSFIATEILRGKKSPRALVADRLTALIFPLHKYNRPSLLSLCLVYYVWHDFCTFVVLI